MDREPDPRGRRGVGQRLRRAPGRLFARVSHPTGLRRPTGLSAFGPASSRQRDRSCAGGADGGLAGTDSSAGATAPADSRRGANGPSSASSGGRSSRTESLLWLGAWLLGLEWRLGMDRRPLRGSADTRRCLGGRALGETRPRLRLDRRRVAVARSIPRHSNERRGPRRPQADQDAQRDEHQQEQSQQPSGSREQLSDSLHQG